MSRDDDASYKLLFSSPYVVRDLVLGFIPDDWQADNPELRRIFAIWIRAMVLRYSRYTLAPQRLLTKRFGPLSPVTVQAISIASTEQIETWLDRLFDAHSVDEVLRP